MALITIEEPDDAAGKRTSPLWALGFRPFYLLGGAFAAVAIPAWLLAYYGRLPATLHIDLLWHLHEMVFGMAVAVVIGFLYTAGKAWTNLWTPRGGQLALIASLWLAGRLAMLTGPGLIGAFVDGLFLPVAAVPFWLVLRRSGNKRNYFMVLLLVLLAVANLCWHAAAAGLVQWSAVTPVRAAIFVVVLIEAVIGVRVLPMFTRNGAPGSKPVVRPTLDKVGLVSTAIAGIAWVAGLGEVLPWAMAVLAALAGVLTLARLAGWAPAQAMRVPLLWILHLSYAWIGAGFLLLALAALGRVAPSAGFHALTVGSMAGLIIGMMCRTSLGHTGRPLKAGRAEVVMFAAIQLAAFARVFAALDGGWRDPAMVLAGAAWTVSFALFVIVYAPRLAAARIDGKEG